MSTSLQPRDRPKALRPRPWLALLLFLSTSGTICRAASNPGGTAAGSNAPFWSSGKGTFSGTDATGASVAATLSVAEVYLDTVASGAAALTYFLAVAQLGGDNGTEDLEFSSPTGLISANFSANVSLEGSPLAGTFTGQTSGVVGGIALAYATASTTESFSATGSGSWTLIITQVVAPDGGVGLATSPLYETVHGTLTADLVDGQGGSGTLQLTF